MLQLLKRGEDPKLIRVLDIRKPTRQDLQAGLAQEVDFRIVDVSNAQAVNEAFEAPWPEHGRGSALTVFHTAANIRFYERHESMLSRSSDVNVKGTQNVLNAARTVGASTMVYTSSGSITIRSSKFLLWPWQKEPDYFVQSLNDHSPIPTRHSHFFSNYAASKSAGEKLVREADSVEGRFRTGCLRPGNGVYGPGGDMLCGAYLVRKTNPTWISNIIQNFIYVENCALAHLLYEARLINPDEKHDLGGDAFNICDPGPPRTYGDAYVALNTLTDGETHFPELSPTGMLIFAYLVEGYYLLRHFWLSWLLPPVNGDLVNLQPSLFSLTQVHVVIDDSRARLPVEKGGLGYRGGWNTMAGLWKTAFEHKKGFIQSHQRSDTAGVSFGFGFVKAQRGVAKIGEKIEEETGVQVLN